MKFRKMMSPKPSRRDSSRLRSLFLSYVYLLKYRSFISPKRWSTLSHFMTRVESRRLWVPFTRFALSEENSRFDNMSLQREFRSNVLPLLEVAHYQVRDLCSGRLSCACEGSAKRRMFAIGNYCKQRLLAPLHTWLAEILSLIPQDGTFDQCWPLDLLKFRVDFIQ